MIITQLGDKYALEGSSYISNNVSHENLISIANGIIAISSGVSAASTYYGTVDNYGITIINQDPINGRCVILNDSTKTMWTGRPRRDNKGGIDKTNYEDINNISTVSIVSSYSNPKGTGYSLSVYNDKLLVGGLTDSGYAGFEYYNGSTLTRYKWSVNRTTLFGQSVSLYENVALVSHNRYIYYYDIENGSSTTLTEDTAKRLDGNTFTPQKTADFGKSVSHIGDIVAIGDPGSNSNEGIVYVHNYATDSTFTIIPQEEEDVTPKRFGSAVFMYENIILIGAPETTVNGTNNAGRVYIYNIDGEFLTSVSGNIEANEYYGMSVAIDKDILAVRCSSGAFAYRAGGELVGDPYIKPMYDTLYKLPDIDAYYRILESKSIKINAQVQKINQEYINQRAKELNDVLFNNIDDDVYEWENMYFFTKICINYNEEAVIFDLLKCNLLNECPSWLQLNIRHEKTKSSCMYENEDVIKVVELKIAEILKIETAVYNNPQILNGLKVKMHKERLNGLLIYKYESESAQVSNLYDTSDCYYKKAVLKNSVEEIFYTNNNTSQIRCIDVV